MVIIEDFYESSGEEFLPQKIGDEDEGDSASSDSEENEVPLAVFMKIKQANNIA